MPRRENSDLVEAAITQAIQSNPDYEEGDLLIDWVVVAYVTNPDEERASMYPMLFSNGELAHYRALGLVHVALEMLRGDLETD